MTAAVRARALVGLVLVVSAAGCGSHGGSHAGSTRLTQAEFAQRGNALCKTYSTKLSKLKRPQTLAEVGPYIDRAGGLIHQELSSLKALSPPASLGVRYRRFLAAATRELALTRQLSAAAKSGDAAKVRALIARGQRLDARANALARGAGLKVCGRPTVSG